MFNIFKIDNSNFFPYTKDAFTLYKKVTSQYKDSKVLNYVKQCVPEKITLELQVSNTPQIKYIPSNHFYNGLKMIL